MLKATGVVRTTDKLGRIVLPKSLRRERGIEAKDDLEIYVDGDSIVLAKYSPGCVFCGRPEGLAEFRSKLVCQECKTNIAGRFGHAAD